ncbi:MAG: hypothetical protein ABIZ80_21405, partial [Bryobacteraceae bacterium]
MLRSAFRRPLRVGLALGVLAAAGANAQVDIRAFGAACDGFTDDRAAVQAAIDSLPVTGGSIVVPCRAAIAAPGISLRTKSNVTVRGLAAGNGFKSLSYGTQGVIGFGPVLFVVAGCTSCTIKDLEFDGAGLNGVPLGF